MAPIVPPAARFGLAFDVMRMALKALSPAAWPTSGNLGPSLACAITQQYGFPASRSPVFAYARHPSGDVNVAGHCSASDGQGILVPCRGVGFRGTGHMADQVVITGLGVVSPIGVGQDAFWDGLRLGRSGAAPVVGLDTSDLPRDTACTVREPIGVARPMGRAAQLAVTAAREAVKSAGLEKGVRIIFENRVRTTLPERPEGCSAQNNPDTIFKDNPDTLFPRLSVVVGTTMGETEFIEQRLNAPAEDWLSIEHLRQIIGGRPGSISANVVADLSARASAIDLYGACAAGNMAINAAARSLLDGDCDVALAGGADGFSKLAFLGFMRLRIMSAGVCRPFDERRDGLLVGEGAAMFVLERESQARARGAPVRARVLGFANSCESYHPTRPDPEGDGLTRATRLALDRAGLQPSDIDYVCAHGTGTPQNDAIEVKVMSQCFPQGVPFSSIKALTGHTMGAAAALEAACCVLSLERQTLIPTWHLEQPLDAGNLEPLRGGARPATVRRVVNNSAGFGGYNSCLVLGAA